MWYRREQTLIEDYRMDWWISRISISIFFLHYVRIMKPNIIKLNPNIDESKREKRKENDPNKIKFGIKYASLRVTISILIILTQEKEQKRIIRIISIWRENFWFWHISLLYQIIESEFKEESSIKRHSIISIIILTQIKIYLIYIYQMKKKFQREKMETWHHLDQAIYLMREKEQTNCITSRCQIIRNNNIKKCEGDSGLHLQKTARFL